MGKFTDLSKEDLDKIVYQYGIEQISDFSAIEGGNENSSFLLKTNNGKFVLTILEIMTVEQVEAWASLLQWLEYHKYNSNKILVDHSGKAVTLYKEKPIFIKEWIEGQVERNMSLNMLFETGHSLCKLHSVPVPPKIPSTPSMIVQLKLPLHCKKPDFEFEAMLKQYIYHFDSQQFHELPKGLTHGDLFYDNVIYNNDHLASIIDFEEASEYYLIYDIAMSIVGLCIHDRRIDIESVQAFLQGYESGRRLKDVEKKRLQYFIQLTAIVIARWRYWKYNIYFENHKWEKRHWEMVEAANQIANIPTSEFINSVFSD